MHSEKAAEPCHALTPPALTAQEIQAVLNRPPLRVPTTVGYQLRLVAAVLGMLLLQALYCLLLLGVAGLIVLLLLSPPSSSLPSLILFRYGLPIGASIAGAFLLKPLFIRPPRPPDAMELTREQEPMLFAFVDQLCHLVGSRRPSRVRLDLQVNACARMCGWRGFVSGDVELIIGLPIVAGLSLHQLAGVLAHEFGHFSQRAGMRSSYLIQRIENWFARVVYQRDFMDDWLDRHRGRGNLYVRAVLWVAHATVWVSRQYLTVLMKVARRLSSPFSHQMEFDADRYEAALTGAKMFEETAAQFALLSVGSKLAWTSAERDWPMNRLPADMVSLAVAHANEMSHAAKRSVILAYQESLTPAEQSHADKSNDDQSTRDEYTSHPTMRRRIEMARSIPAIAGAKLDGPASRAFANFPELCRAATHHHYETMMGLSLEEVDLIDSQDVLTAMATAHANYAAATELLQLRPEFAIHWFQLPGFLPSRDGSTLETHAVDEKLFTAQLRTHLNHYSALCIRRAGVPVRSESFQLRSADLNCIQREEAESMTSLRLTMRGAQAQRQHVAQQIEATLFEVLNGDKALPPDRAHPSPAESALVAWECYVALSSVHLPLLDLRRYCAAAWNIRVNRRFFSKPAYERALSELQTQAEAKRAEILSATQHTPNLMRGSSTARSNLAAQLSVSKNPQDQIDPFQNIRIFLDRAELIAVRSLGELSWMTQEALTKKNVDTRVAELV